MKMKEIRYLRRQEKKRLAEETNELIIEAIDDQPRYQQIKKWKWWQFLVSIFLVILGVGLSFLVGYLTYDQIKTPGWQGAAWFAGSYASIGIFIWLVLGFIKNQRAIKFYNNRRQRYRPTYQASEARVQVIRRIIILAWIPFMIFTIVIAILF